MCLDYKIDKLKRKKQMEWGIGLIIVIVIIAIKGYISLHMQSPFIFSDEQSYFGMADKIAKGGFDKIRNSHMPGYSLLLAPLYMLTKSSLEAYHIALLFNSVAGAISYVLVFYLCKYVWKMEGKHSILVSVIVSLASAFYAYNYVIMSETIQTLFYLIFFVLFCDVIWRKRGTRSLVWFEMGIVLGFLPIIKTQALIMMVLYMLFVILYQMTDGEIINKKGLIISACVSILTFCLFRYGLFSNVGLYEEQSGDNLKSLLTIFADVNNFGEFVRIVLAEFAYFFVTTGLIPVFFVLLYAVHSLKKVIKSKECLIISLFCAFTVLGNVAITIIHAYHVYIEKNNATVYARYLDMFQPILITVGLALLLKNRVRDIKFSKKTYVFVIVCVSVLVFIIYPSLNKIEANTFSVVLFNGMPYAFFVVVFGCALLLCGIILAKGNGIVFACIYLFLLFLAMDYKCVSVQISRGTEMVQTLGAAHYFADNQIERETVVLDRAVFGDPMKEDYTPGTATPEMFVDKGMELNFRYSMMFWVLKNNSVKQKEISIKDSVYIYTDKLLPRRILAVSGPWMLYDKTVSRDYDVPIDAIYRTSDESMEFVNAEYLRVKSDFVTTNLYLDEIKEFTIRIFYSDNITILPGEDEIHCSVGEISLEYIPEEEAVNYITFKYTGQEPITVESVQVKYSGKYDKIIEEGNLYLKSMKIQY